MTAQKLLITGALRPSAELLAGLETVGFELLFVQNELEELTIDVSDVACVICNGLFLHTPLERFSSLRYIHVTSAGLDRLPLEEIRARGIELFSARGVYSIPMAEWAVAGVLALYKNLRGFMEAQAASEWRKDRTVRELHGKSALVLGFGSVGQEVAKRFWALGMRVSALDLFPCSADYLEASYTFDELEAAVANADVLVLTLPLTEQTHHLFDASMLARLKGSAVLVNIARGPVVDEAALVAALKSGALSGAVLDVFEAEPLAADSPLWGMPQVIATPHNSFVSEQNADRLEGLILQNLTKYFS